MPPLYLRRTFPSATLHAIEKAISRSERHHRGELRFVIENSLPPLQVWRGQASADRAREVFSGLRIWDTEENSGILIYLMLADHEVHIVADRGIAGRVGQNEWNVISETMRKAFRRGNFREGALAGIESIPQLLSRHFPAGPVNPNEISDRPVIIKQ